MEEFYNSPGGGSVLNAAMAFLEEDLTKRMNEQFRECVSMVCMTTKRAASNAFESGRESCILEQHGRRLEKEKSQEDWY